MPKRNVVIGLVIALVATVVGGGVLAIVAVVALLGAGSATANACQDGQVATAGGPVRMPVTGAYLVTSNYGMRFDPVYQRYQLHAGMDFAMTPTGPVVAAAAGAVDEVVRGYGGGRGNYVTIAHGGGLRTRYQHLASIEVALGQQVTAGQVVGMEGDTGASKGAHLHFETLVNGQTQDPRIWLTQNGLTVPLKGQGGTAPPPGGATAPSATSSSSPTIASTGTPGGLPTEVGRWRGEQIVNAGYVIKAGQTLGLDAWTVTVGVMTAMGESSLRILDYGDGVGPDSRGLFQQRDNGAWGTYADRMNPTISATNFFRALTAVPGYRTMAPTIAAHNAQHNADPYHYAQFWPDAVRVVAAVTADTSLLSTLSGDGALASCGTDTAADLPPAPSPPCPATANPVETRLNPVARDGARCILAAYPQLGLMAVADRGASLDVTLLNYRSVDGRATGWQLANWLRENAATLGVQVITYDMKTWTAANPASWNPYTRS